MKLVRAGREYVFENRAEHWLIVNDKQDGFLELPVTPADDAKALPGEPLVTETLY